MKILNDDGEEIEVFTATEVQTQISAKETEFNTEKATLNGRVTELSQALEDRAGQFKQVRKLSEESVSKLSMAERTIYENGLVLAEAIEGKKIAEEKIVTGQVDTAIRSLTGTDDKLFAEMKKMWGIVGIEATDVTSIDSKAKMIVGMLSVSQPDLIAGVQGFSGGGFIPAGERNVQNNSHVSTERLSQGAKELGLDAKALGITQ